MDRIVFIAVTLALLVATQAQAKDPYFNAHCEESQEVMAAVQPQAMASDTAMAPADSGRPAAEPGRVEKPVQIKSRKARKGRA